MTEFIFALFLIMLDVLRILSTSVDVKFTIILGLKFPKASFSDTLRFRISSHVKPA